MTTPDPYAHELTPPVVPDEDFSHLPDNDPGTEGIDPDEQGTEVHE